MSKDPLKISESATQGRAHIDNVDEG